LPPSLTSLKFNNGYHHVINIGVLPNNLNTLTFKGGHVQEIIPGALPDTLETLVIERGLLQLFKVGSLPQSLTVLNLENSSYDQSFAPGVLPTGLQRLVLTQVFVQPLLPGHLPSSLKSLDLGRDYNHPLTVGTLPNSLTKLVIGPGFKQALEVGSLPDSLVELVILAMSFQSLVVGSLPSSLKRLSLSPYFNLSIPVGFIPDSLEELKFEKMIYFRGRSLRSFNQSIIPGSLPSSLLTLVFHCESFNQPILPGQLPISMTSLTLSRLFNQELTIGTLPESLISLTFGDSFNRPIPINVLPSSLTTLALGSKQKYSIKCPDIKHLQVRRFHQLKLVKTGSPIPSLTVDNVSTNVRKETLPLFERHLTTLTIKAHTPSTASSLIDRRRAFFLKSIIHSFPNADTYHISDDNSWSASIRKIDRWHAIMILKEVLDSYSSGKKVQPFRQTIHYFTLDSAAGLVIQLEDINKRLKQDNDHLLQCGKEINKLKEENKQTKTRLYELGEGVADSKSTRRR
ncbi:hypothetical protein SAMD00019534_098140, partial [Acytostelium subglobosum LB1]|uniref:hypothetical protein n=1 Tax=Acytostelium subglobosum LB1 TaxID=1410327 RepID=UPI00064496A8